MTAQVRTSNECGLTLQLFGLRPGITIKATEYATTPTMRVAAIPTFMDKAIASTLPRLVLNKLSLSRNHGVALYAGPEEGPDGQLREVAVIDPQRTPGVGSEAERPDAANSRPSAISGDRRGARGRPVVEVADRVGCHLSMAYEWIHRFNSSGFRTCEQAPNPKGRPPIITGPQVCELIDIALSSPTERG